MRCFFNLTGRLGNLLFQYCFARAFCEQHGHTLCIPPWVGERIFSIPLADRTPSHQCDKVETDVMHQDQFSLIYTRKQAREWLQIRPELLGQLQPLMQNRKPVLLDVRMGRDFLGAGLVSLGKQCYLDAAAKHGYHFEDCEWEIDTLPTRLPFFQGDVEASGLNTTWVSLPAFFRMMTASVHFRANSTFSWWAATLGNAKVYSPVIRGVRGGQPNAYAEFVEGNYPVMADTGHNTDLVLKEE